MANLFKNPLVVAENVVGSILDLRHVILYEQPENYTPETTIDSESGLISSITQTAIGAFNKTVQNLVGQNQPTELFTGIDIPVLTNITGANIYGISYMNAKVGISSDICEHPTETGGKISDYAIINPITATVNVSMPTALYTRVYAQIEKFYKEKRKILLQTKFTTHSDMVIASMPYVLDAATVDRPTIELNLKQVIEVKPEYINDTEKANSISEEKSFNPSDSDTTDLGRVNVTETTGL